MADLGIDGQNNDEAPGIMATEEEKEEERLFEKNKKNISGWEVVLILFLAMAVIFFIYNQATARPFHRPDGALRGGFA